MAAIVTDQFRISNTTNFINSFDESSYYIFLGLPNPEVVGFGRNSNWQTSNNPSGVIPNPIDNFSYTNHYKDTVLFGKRVTTSNVRRVVRKIEWRSGSKYDFYRHDYSSLNLTPVTNKSRLYDSNYFVVNSEFKVYICLDNGATPENPSGNASIDEPNFVDLEPSKAGESGDGYIWKYLYTISPVDIVKFDSTEYVTLPNNWSNSTDSQITSVRENADSRVNNNQIKTVYIQNAGAGYISGEVNILGDGTGGRVFIETNASGNIINATVTSGGSGYSYGIVDLGSLQPSPVIPNPAKLIVIIPPSLGHGYDIYTELGADRVLLYSRFDDSTKDFPVDTRFCQVGLIKDPSRFLSTETYTENQYSSLYSLKFSSVNGTTPIVGEKISQITSNGSISVGYMASFDSTTNVMKYIKDRSLYFSGGDETDYIGISTTGNQNIEFDFNGSQVTAPSGFSGTIDANYTGITTTINNQIINLDSQFVNGLSTPEINSNTGDLIYIDNRPLVGRSSRQKEDVKIILEF